MVCHGHPTHTLPVIAPSDSSKCLQDPTGAESNEAKESHFCAVLLFQQLSADAPAHLRVTILCPIMSNHNFK